MRNYKIKTREIYGIFGKKEDFSNEQKQQLKDLGFSLTFLDTIYKKSIGFVTIQLILGKEYLTFYYSGVHFLPCELNYYIKDKETLKKINEVIKELKIIEVL
jgi:hypothetical protein